MHRAHDHDHDGMPVTENGVKTGKPLGIAFINHVPGVSRRGIRRTKRVKHLGAQGIVVARIQCVTGLLQYGFRIVRERPPETASARTILRCSSTPLASSRNTEDRVSASGVMLDK
jgi:hypothetical protein